MASSLWSSLAFAVTVLALGALVVRLLWQRDQLRAQVTGLIRDTESLNDRLWSLADSEERYRSLIEAQGDLIVRRDGARIVYANRAFATLFGVSEIDLVGSKMQLPQLASRPMQLLEGGARSFDECLATYEGERWISWVETAVPGPKGRSLIQRVGRDISARIAV